MITQKTTIFFVLCILNFPGFSSSSYQAGQDNNGINIDSVRSGLDIRGWNNSFLETYRNYLINTDRKLNNELNRLNELPGDFQKKYLKSVILKREGKYKEMYVLLLSLLNQNPDFLPFYDDLFFAAVASGNKGELKSSGTDILKPYYNKYLRALSQYNEGSYSDALILLKEMLTETPADKYLLYQISYTYRNLGNYTEGLKFINAAISSDKNDKFFLAEAYLTKGTLYYLSGKYQVTEEYYKKAYTLSKGTNNKLSLTRSLIDMGVIEDQTGSIERARKYYSEAISISEKYNFKELNALAYSEQGVSYTFTSELLKAKKSYLASYTIYEKLGNNLRLSLLSDNIAKLYLSQFNYTEAKELYEDGLRFAGENKRAQALNLTGLADVYANLANYARALEYYNKAKEITAQLKEINLETEINNGLGSLYFNLNNFNRALENFGKTQELSMKSGDPYSLADSYHNLGLTYFRIDILYMAESNLEKAIEISSKYNNPYTQAVALIDLAYLYSKSSQIGKAFKLIEEAKNISQKYNFTYLREAASVLEGKIYEDKKDLLRAENIYKHSIEETKALQEPNLTIELHFLLAGIHEKNNKYSLAENEYQKATEKIEKISRSLYSKDQVQISYFSAKSEVYEAYADLLAKEKKYQEAFLVTDRSRSRNTIQNLFNLKIESYENNRNSLDKLYDFEWIINSGLYSVAETDSVNKMYKDLRNKITGRYPELTEIFADENNYTVKDIQRSLNSEEYLISYTFSGNKLMAYLIGKNEFRHFFLDISRDVLKSDLAEISPYFSGKNNKIFFNHDLFSFNSEKSNLLFKKILEPVLAEIPHNSKIILSPCPELVSTPFEFFVTNFDSSESPYNYNGSNFLVNDYQVSYTPSVRLYVTEKENHLGNNNKVLIVGNPTIKSQARGYSERRGILEEGQGLPRGFALLPLKYSEDEVNEIGNMIGADKILVENDATETGFKMNANYSKIIHLSTHSFLINNQPVIFLSNYYDPANDGLLEASEIIKMKLNSDLVVLSSCNSGLGKLDQSEGIIGMTKAFYEAGVKSVIVSLWPVNDKYTSKLMGLFYENLTNGMNKSEALRNAKITFIKKYSANPYYWSAFVLSGNTSHISLDKKKSLYPYLIVLSGIVLIAVVIVYNRNKKQMLRP